MSQTISYQGAILDCIKTRPEISTTNIMREIRERLRFRVPFDDIHTDCELLFEEGKLNVRLKAGGKGKYWSLAKQVGA